MVIAVPELLMSTPMHSIVQVQESPPLIGQGLLPKPMVVPYLNSFDVLVEGARLSLVKIFSMNQ
jgi:hypothetical protein